MRIAILVCAILLSGCATSINKQNALNYSQAGISAQKSGNWDAARTHWAKAVVNARLAKEPNTKLAVYTYEYGRSLGATCYFEESEKYLNQAYELDLKTNGPTHMDLTELALLNLDQKKWQSALEYFQKSFKELEKLNALTEAPHAYADTLDDYALALENLGNKEASEYRERAKDIREQHAQGYSITDRTPYGKHCSN